VIVRRELLTLVLGLAAACQAEPGPNKALCPTPPEVAAGLRPIEELGFVAHAGGSPHGLEQLEPYSNSREAFEISYQNGFRVFEFDFLVLADGAVVVAHDYHEAEYGLSISFHDATRADVEGRLWNGEYRVMFAEDIIDLLVEHPDIWIILDSKWGHVEVAKAMVELAPDTSVLDRIVPHLADDQHAASIPDIYPFPEQMVAGYRWRGSDDEFLDRMDRYGVDNIMVWWDMRWTEDLQAKMDAAGYHVWVHSPEDPDVIEDFRARGVGVYSNGWIPCSP
jgi:glycerophosphoryl diester phosphodiesterase